jgi:hypothetical protein
VKFCSPKSLCVVAAMAAIPFFGSGCLGGGGSLTNLPDGEFATVNLVIRLGKIDAETSIPGDVGMLVKAAANEKMMLKHLVMRFTSNLNDTVWDTVASLDGPGLGSGQSADRAVLVDVKLAPLRWWNIEIKTHDQNDSIIHYGKVGPFASKGGQTVSLNIPMLNSRFSLYEARYALPSRIYPAGVPEAERVYQKVFFSRLVLEIDSQIVRDTSSFSPAIVGAGSRFITAGTSLKGAQGKFFFKPTGLLPDTITHTQSYNYVRTGPRVFTVSAYGYLEGDTVGRAPRLLFKGSRSITVTPGATTPVAPVDPVWKGPGTSSPEPGDTTNVTPGTENWTGVAMSIFIGKSVMVIQPVIVPGGIDLF